MWTADIGGVAVCESCRCSFAIFSIVPGDCITSLVLFVVVRGSSTLPSTSRAASQCVMVVYGLLLVGRVHAVR